MAPRSNKNAPVPDPHNSPVGRKLLEYKGLLRQVQRQLPRPVSTPIHRREIETPIQDLDKIKRGIASLENRAGIEYFLYSTDAIGYNLLQAIARLNAALFAYDKINGTGVSPGDQTKYIYELTQILYECPGFVQEALNQFRI